MNWSDLNWNDRADQEFDSWSAYCQSKLANLMHCKELARRLRQDRISVYSVHPGIVDTDLIKWVSKTTNSQLKV